MRKQQKYIFLLDVLALLSCLWLALVLRHFDFLVWGEFLNLILPFAVLFVIYLFVFYLFGIYDHQQYTSLSNIFNKLVYLHTFNLLLGITLFYLVPYFAVQPKTILIIVIGLSLAWFCFSRLYLLPLLLGQKKKTLILAEGRAVQELLESKNNFYFNFDFEVANLNSPTEIFNKIKQDKVEVLILDFQHQFVKNHLADLYHLFFRHIVFLDLVKFYEDYFEREPITLLSPNWCLKKIDNFIGTIHDKIMRIIDIVGSLLLSLVAILFLPFIVLAIKLDDGGRVFFSQERIGQNGRKIKIWKIRTMTFIDETMGELKNQNTRVGNFLRKTRLDELPQLWNVFKGDLSLIGPRPERPQAVEIYAQKIPYYNVRHLVRPGLSGWAQLNQQNHPHQQLDVEATEEKLSYDLYYISHRSLWFNLKIATRTLLVILRQEGK